MTLSRKMLMPGFVAVGLFVGSQTAFSENKPIGATLNNKVDLAITAIPEAVLTAIKAVRPEVIITGAEKEWKNGNTYIDVEAEDSAGNEVEFDMLLGEQGWQIIEIQRDITFSETPEPVRVSLLKQLPNVEPARIIESDQGDGVIIYEFFVVSAQGDEGKYEVKFADGEADFLTEEWTH